ncbi:MAG: DMT family transporter [Gammaproteobacteria bacterium]
MWLIFLAALCDATAGPLTRMIGATTLVAIVFWRQVFAAAFVAAMILKRQGWRGLLEFPRGNRSVAAAGFAAASGLFFWSLAVTSVALTFVLGLFGKPVFLVVLGGLILGETPSWKALCALAFGFIGVLVMVKTAAVGVTATGLLLVAGSALAYSVAMIASHRAGVDNAEQGGRLQTLMWQHLVLGVCVTPCAIGSVASIGFGRDLGIAVALGVVQQVGQYYFLIRGMERQVTTARAAVILLAAAPLAIFMAWPWERPTLLEALGAAMVLTSIAMDVESENRS